MTRCPVRATVLTLAFAPLLALADTRVRQDTDDPSGAPFPSDRYTVRDGSQATFRRVALPKPDCAVRPSDCADIDVINSLDGFSTQPRLTVPFTGDIDPATVNSETVYLLNLGDTLTLRGFGQRVGIDQVVWDPATKTLAFESGELLAERSRYLLVVTDGVRDARGKKIKSDGWGAEFGLGHGRADYRRELRDGVQALRGGRHQPVAASLFTTQSIGADLEKIMKAIKASTPSPVDFTIGLSAAGPVRAVFPIAQVAGIQFQRQTGTAAFTPSFVPTPALDVVPGAVAQVAYGRFRSPDYQNAYKVIPATPTLTGLPQPQGENAVLMQLFVPAVARPATGWPVAIFGHGFTDSLYGAPWTVASVLASRGIATLSINVVGHGGGAAGTLNVLRSGGLPPVVLPAGGRGIDQDGNGSIDSTEGVNAVAPYGAVGSRDGLRQTVVDLMQLVRQVEAGVDVDGDGGADLDAQRIYYAGQSFGGIYGTIVLGVEPALKAGVPNVPGGSITEIARLSPAFRGLSALSLATRVPNLINLPAGSPGYFDENLPLRGEPPRVNTVPGAMAIQQVLDRFEWVQQAGNPAAYAPYIRRQPLPGQTAKPVIVQIAQGDMTVPNPTSTAIVRAGQLADRTTRYRHDLAWVANPMLSKNPHTFLTNIGSAAAAPYAVMAQTQMALFFASHGTLVVDPDGAGPWFEVPIAGPLPEALNFIP